jgi:hypothetical protein
MVSSVEFYIADHFTGSQLLWAVMDQIVVHLSIGHATLPRIQTFLSHLQIGGISTNMSSGQSGTRTTAQGRVSAAKATQDYLRRSKVGQTSEKAWNSLCSRLTGSLKRSPSISEQPLRYRQQQQGIELSTIVCSGEDE